jgi:hypothetical protein
MPNFTAGTSFTDGVTNDVTAAKLNALVADAVPTSSLALASTSGTISNFTSSTATLLGAITGSTNVINIGSGQIYKDASGNVGVANTTPSSFYSGANNLVIGSGSGEEGLTIYGGNASASYLAFADGTTGDQAYRGSVKYDHSVDAISLQTGAAERLRIDSSGKVGIGTTSPAGRLDVAGGNIILNGVESTPLAIQSGDSSVGLIEIYGGATNKGGTIQFRGGGNSGDLRFLTGTTGTGSERLRIDSSGNVGIGLTPTSRNNTRLQIVDGIGFPATQVASSDANTLDDYEEGTWTIGVSFGGASAGVTYSANTGQYTKIGNKVSVSGDLTLTASGSSTGNARITGLPFTIRNAAEAAGGVAIGFITSTSFADFPQGFGDIGATTIALRETTNAGANTALTNTDFGNSSRIIFTYTYFV